MKDSVVIACQFFPFSCSLLYTHEYYDTIREDQILGKFYGNSSRCGGNNPVSESFYFLLIVFVSVV